MVEFAGEEGTGIVVGVLLARLVWVHSVGAVVVPEEAVAQNGVSDLDGEFIVVDVAEQPGATSKSCPPMRYRCRNRRAKFRRPSPMTN